jgi:hypothetical protein
MLTFIIECLHIYSLFDIITVSIGIFAIVIKFKEKRHYPH